MKNKNIRLNICAIVLVPVVEVHQPYRQLWLNLYWPVIFKPVKLWKELDHQLSPIQNLTLENAVQPACGIIME